MIRMFVPFLAIAVLATMNPSVAGAAQRTAHRSQARRNERRQHQQRIGGPARSAARHRREDRRAHHRVPPEERPIQENRGNS